MVDFSRSGHVQYGRPLNLHIDAQDILYPQLGSHSAARAHSSPPRAAASLNRLSTNQVNVITKGKQLMHDMIHECALTTGSSQLLNVSPVVRISWVA